MTRVLILLGLVSAPVVATEIVHLDGTRTNSERVVVKDDVILVAFDKGMRQIPKAGVAMIVNDDGGRVILDRKLVEGAPASQADIKALETADGAAYLTARQRLAASMSREVFAKAKELSKAKKPETRARAGEVLAGLGVPESLDAAVAIALKDKSAAVRNRVASSLFAIIGLIEAHDWHAKLRPGLESEHQKTRATFALVLGMAGDKAAIPVLKRDALRHRDHHFRESAAETLARLGDDAGVDVLVKMLRRKRHPAGEEILVVEKIRICGHLERLGAKKALPALRREAKSSNGDLAAAALRAVKAIAAKQTPE